jgi:predicted nuclease of predicted toxin-antitoxin system
MILIDNSQVVIASLFHSLNQTNEIDEDFVRHLVLNSYRFYRNKFVKKYGELVICSDTGNYWRKDYFPQYKQNRKRSQEKSNIDWRELFNGLNSITNELKDYFPYKFLAVEQAEADDIIASLCMKYGETEKIMIVSSDKDFQQLQRYSNVKQYSPSKKDYLVCENPEEYLIEHTIRGDSSDGIPNILSDDDAIINTEKRQARMTKKKVSELRAGTLTTDEIEKNWKRNQILVDFKHIPEDIMDTVFDEFEKEPIGRRKDLLNYFIDHRLKNLMENIGDF